MPAGVEWIQRARRALLLRRLTRALRLGPRAAERRGPQRIQRLSTHLDIEWYAHDVHPWDADLAAGERARILSESVLTHTLDAVRRAFERFPQVDSIHITVLDPRKPHGTLLKGRVAREELPVAADIRSTGMALKLLGIEYRLEDGGLRELS